MTEQIRTRRVMWVWRYVAVQSTGTNHPEDWVWVRELVEVSP